MLAWFLLLAADVPPEWTGTLVNAGIGGISAVAAAVVYLVVRLLNNADKTQDSHLKSIGDLVTSSQEKDKLLGAQTASIEKLGEATEANTEATKQNTDRIGKLEAAFDRWTESQLAKAGVRTKPGGQ